MLRSLALLLLLVPSADGLYAGWTHGPPSDPNFFPIAVWLQSPANASKYREAGINTYVALWRGPTADQLDALKAAGKKIVWNCIEASRISNETVKPDASQIRAEAWMSLIHGSNGLIYFVHQFKP